MKRSSSKRGLVLAAAVSVLFANNIFSQDLASAILLTKSEQYDKSEAMLQQLSQKEPGNSKYYFYLGENILLDYFADTISNSVTLVSKTAHDIFQKGVDANASDPLNYVGLAKVAVLVGDAKTAADMRAKARGLLLPYKNIKKIVPPARDYAFALAKIAESYIDGQDVDTAAALPLIRQAIIIDNKNPEIFLITGDIYILVNDGSNSIRNYNLAQYLDPKSPTATMKIGYIYMRAKSYSSAIQYFEDAIKLDANYAPVYRELGQLYLAQNKYEQSQTNYQKYLALNEGNIPAQTRYVTSLFYGGDYDKVIKNVEEILAVDKSRSYMNRLAGYSYYEKKNPDYGKALQYMDQLFKTVSADRILYKDYYYTARILMKKNQNYAKMADDLDSQDQQLQKDKSRYASASAVEKTKLKPALDEETARVEKLRADVTNTEKEINRGFAEYKNVIELRPQDRAVKSELAANYYAFRRYDDAAKVWAMLIDPKNEKPGDWMQIGRAFYNGGKLKTADSVFTVVINKWPDQLQAYLWDARTYFRMDPDYKMGLARPKFEKLIDIAESDSLKNESEMMEALQYLGYYHMSKNNMSTARDYYNRIINLDPNSKENKIKGYNGLGLVEINSLNNEKTNEGRLPILARAADAYNRILAIDPANASAKAQISWIRDYEGKVKSGINPNEIKGVVTDVATGAPVAYASIKVKDTAAENLTDPKGAYRFEIPQGSEVLVISAKGYKTQEITITKSRVYNVKLSK